MNKEIGGYFELERQTNCSLEEFHKNAIAINLGRNALPFLALTLKIKVIYLPYYLCDSVENACISCGIKVKKYHIDSNFLPIFNLILKKDEFLYIVNYFGLLENKTICDLKRRYKNLIIDNVQSFFSLPIKNTPTIYSCRKFFGVPDGGYIYSKPIISLTKDSSADRFKHLKGRLNTTAEEYFSDYKKNEDLLSHLPLLAMSDETHSILEKIDYKNVKSKRTRNFNYLDKNLFRINQLKIGQIHGAYCYPLLIENGKTIREKLIKNRIYIPLLWPNLTDLNSFEEQLVSNLLILPCDQRYNTKDMERIINLINEN